MINLNSDPMFLVNRSVLSASFKSALIDIKNYLSEAGYSNEIRKIKNQHFGTNADRYHFSGEEFIPVLPKEYTAFELTSIILSDSFIEALDVNENLIVRILEIAKYENKVTVANRSKQPEFRETLINPVIDLSSFSYYGVSGDQYVLSRFWHFLALPILTRLWQENVLVLPIDSKLTIVHVNSAADRLLYHNLCIPNNASIDLVRFLEMFSLNKKENNSKVILFDLLNLLLATDWLQKMNLFELKETFILHSYYWKKWDSQNMRGMTPILLRTLNRNYGIKPEYVSYGTVFQNAIKVIPAYKQEIEEIRMFAVSEAERLLLMEQISITKDEVDTMDSNEAWDFWGNFDAAKLLYESQGKFNVSLFSFDRLNLFFDCDMQVLADWVDYGKVYTETLSPNSSLRNYQGGTKVVLKYLLYLIVWFKEHSPNFDFPSNFSKLTRSVFLIRESEEQELPRTLSEFFLEFSNQSLCGEFSKFLKWIQVDSTFLLEVKHSQSNRIVTTAEFKKSWFQAKSNIFGKRSSQGDAKLAFDTSDYATLKYYMKSIENYFIEVQRFIIKRVEEATENPDGRVLWEKSEGPELDPSFYLKVSETALIDLGWESLGLHRKGIIDEKRGPLARKTKVCTSRLSFMSIDLEKSREHLPANCFNVSYLDTLDGEIKITTLSGTIPVITPVRRMHNQPLNVDLMMPMLNVLRPQMVTASLGLRHLHGFTLDENEFDSYIDHNVDKELGVTTLLITTDKVKTRPWLRPVSYSTMEIMYREIEFKKIYSTHYKDDYKYNEQIQFKCLFSQPNTGKPASDKTRTEGWNNLLIGFSSFISIIRGRTHSYLRWCPVAEGTGSVPNLKNKFYEDDAFVIGARRVMPNAMKNENGIEVIVNNEYTAISLRSKHTPHSTRNTFISSLTGSMDLADIASLVGQNSIATTVHYNQVTKEKFKKYKESHRAVVTPQSSNDSKVVKSFKSDRIKTELNFGFTSVDVHQEDPRFIENKGSTKRPQGLILLRTASQNTIAFCDTHICSFNMNCPEEVVEENSGYRKCGICRVKVTGIDHAPAIAKNIELLEIELLNAFIKHNKHKISTGTTETNFKVNYDEIAFEMAGWELSLQLVEKKRQELLKSNIIFENEGEKPELLDSNIHVVKSKTPVDELILTAIEEAPNFPSMVEYSKLLTEVSRRLKAKILFSLASASPKKMELYIDEITNTDASGNTLLQVSSLIKSLINTKAVTSEQLIELISNERQDYSNPTKRLHSFLNIDNAVKKEASRIESMTSIKVIPNDED